MEHQALRCRSFIAVVFFCCGLACPPISGQQPEPVLQEEILVREVFLDVVVTDRKGNAIVGLDADDFLVEENDEEVEVTSVTFYDSRPLVEPGRGESARTDRYYILFFHDQRRGAPALASSQMDVGRHTRKWVASELEPNDRVAVLGYDVRLQVYQDFTDDRAALDEAIKRAALGKKGLENWPSRLQEAMDEDSPSLLAGLPIGKQLRKQSRTVQEALELVGHAASGFVGRKNLIFFSLGFGDVSGFGQWIPDPRYYPDMREALNNGSVAVYPIDMIAVRTGSRTGGLGDSLNSLAVDTGGEYYFTFANALSPLRRLAEDSAGYYLLSYSSRHPSGETGYREVKVRVRDGSFRVRARDGYLYGE